MGAIIKSDAPTLSIATEREMHLPVDGKIRPGIKVLTKAAAGNTQAKAIYETGVRAGKAFDDIEREIAEQTHIASPLIPRNIPFFVLHERDFKHPEIVKKITDAYGEDRGDGKRRLYRFPVMFPFDDPLRVIPHALKCFGASGIKYWSDYDREGARRCMTYAPIPINEKTKRVVRVFGGRKVAIRTDNGGLCQPESCGQYQTKQCNLSGSIVFYIPGIPGAGLIELPLTSWYGISGALSQLEMVRRMRGGKISGLQRDGAPIFWISKKQKEVSMIRDDGSSARVQQWIIDLEANLVVSSAYLEAIALDDQAAKAAAMLSGSTVAPIAFAPVVEAEAEAKAGADADDVTSALTWINAAIESIAIPYEAFAEYAASKWGVQWTQEPRLIAQVTAEVSAHVDDPAYKKKILDSWIPFE